MAHVTTFGGTRLQRTVRVSTEHSIQISQQTRPLAIASNSTKSWVCVGTPASTVCSQCSDHGYAGGDNQFSTTSYGGQGGADGGGFMQGGGSQTTPGGKKVAVPPIR
jgi:hypothetical protein